MKEIKKDNSDNHKKLWRTIKIIAVIVIVLIIANAVSEDKDYCINSCVRDMDMCVEYLTSDIWDEDIPIEGYYSCSEELESCIDSC